MQKISYLLKNSFKKTVQFFFKLIYGTINSDQNKISKKNIFIKEVSSLKKKNNTNYKVCKIVNGRAYTDFVENLAVIENQTELENFSYDFDLVEVVNGKRLDMVHAFKVPTDASPEFVSTIQDLCEGGHPNNGAGQTLL